MTGPGTSAPSVMGRSAALVTVSLLATVGLAQLAGFKVSGVIDRASDHAYLGTVWGASFVLAGALIVIAWRVPDAFTAMVFEIAALVCAIGGLVFYANTLFVETPGWPTSGTVTLALCAAAVTNFTGRAIHLYLSCLRWIVTYRPGTRSAALSARILGAVAVVVKVVHR